MGESGLHSSDETVFLKDGERCGGQAWGDSPAPGRLGVSKDPLQGWVDAPCRPPHMEARPASTESSRLLPPTPIIWVRGHLSTHGALGCWMLPLGPPAVWPVLGLTEHFSGWVHMHTHTQRKCGNDPTGEGCEVTPWPVRVREGLWKWTGHPEQCFLDCLMTLLGCNKGLQEAKGKVH